MYVKYVKKHKDQHKTMKQASKETSTPYTYFDATTIECEDNITGPRKFLHDVVQM